MKLKTQLKWRLNELLALRELPEGGAAWRQRFKALCADVTPACAAEIMSAKPGDALYPLSRRRKLWATLGYAFIVLFLVAVAGFVLSYWLISDHRASWLDSRALFLLLGAAAVSTGAMLLSANRVTALQNERILRAVKDVLVEVDALPVVDSARMARVLGQGLDPEQKIRHCINFGCCACGALLTPEDFGESTPAEKRCPRCGEQYQMVFGTPEAPLDGDFVNRLRSFLNK